MYDVVALGEVLIDFSPAGTGPMGNPCFEMNPGGAPANCLAANTVLGGSTAFIGMVGNDFFGRFLKKYLQEHGIDVSGMSTHENVPTTIDFVSNREDGERDFAFFRNPGADFMISTEHIDERILTSAKIFHFGSLSLTHEPARSATYQVLERLKKKGIPISYDPNDREDLWESQDIACREMKRGLDYADIVKLSEQEMEMLTGCGTGEYARGASRVLEGGAGLVFITCGPGGAYYATREERGMVSGFPVHAVDTTGCGDAFIGAIHYQLCHCRERPLREMVRYANAAGALCATGHTGMPAMPDRERVEKFINEREEGMYAAQKAIL